MLKEGLEVKDYTLKKFLGKGGFGEVWLAEKKIEIADRKVPFALKFISNNNQEISDYSTVRREINTWIDASGNKNIISVHDGFIYENLFVIVSEYANNGSLRQWLKEHGGKSPGLEKTVEVMSGILDGLTHLHGQNIVHRDLKPENVLLKGDVPCIADFGVSRIVESVSLDISQAGTNTAGSPLYMSPESFERNKPSPQIDIWSAGVMLFEMLSGKTPYIADTIPSLIYEIVTKEPRSLPADIPESFHKVVKKALAKDISDRFSSAREMREALTQALHPEHQTSGIDMLKTLPVNNESPTVQFIENKSDKGKKKTFVWAGLSAAIILAAAIGIFTLTQSSADSNSNQRNDFISNQAVLTEKNINNNSAAVNETIPAPQNIEKPIEKPIEKKTEKINVEKEKPQPNQRTATKADSAPVKAPPKRTPQTKKKVTLDDLINND
jgi:serine/threonine protein kinase